MVLVPLVILAHLELLALALLLVAQVHRELLA